MNRMRSALLGLSLLGLPASASGFQDSSFANAGGWQPAAFWCDAGSSVLALTRPAGDFAQAAQPTTLVRWTGLTGRSAGRETRTPWQLGPQDAGAGQLYTALTPRGQPVSSSPASFVHSSNIENTQDPAYRMTAVVAVRLPQGDFSCRYVPQAAVLAATARHGVIVWEYRGHVTYASRNRGGTPGVQLTGGTHTGAPGGEQTYRWEKRGYVYELTVSQAGQGGALRVLRGGRVLSREPLLAYSVSVAK